MNINAINASAINLEALLSPLGEVQKTTDAATGKETLTLSVQANGTTGAYKVDFPQMETPGATTPEVLGSLISKLQSDGGLKLTDNQLNTLKGEAEKTLEKTAKAINTVAATSKGSVMFDIYSLMALLIEVAQKQKEANRESQRAQDTAMLKAIQNQADQQMAAARIGLIVGVVCSAVTVVASAATMAVQSHAFGKQQQITRDSGLSASNTKVSALSNTDTVAHAEAHLNTVEAKVGGEVSARVQGEFGQQLVDDQAGNLSTNFDHARADLATKDTARTTARTELQTAQTELETVQTNQRNAQSALDTKKAEVNYDAKAARFQELDAAHNQNPNSGEGLVEWAAAKADFDAAKAAVSPLQNQLAAADNAVTAAQNKVNLKQNDVTLANEAYATAKTNFQNAKADYVKTVQDIGDQYAERYQTALERQSNPPAGADKAQLAQDVQTTRSEMEMARAYEAKLLAADDVMTPAEQKEMVMAARAEATATSNQVINRLDFKQFEHRIQILAGLNGIISSLGQMGQNVAQGISGMKSAEATATGAEEKRQETLSQQSKELYDEEQKLIDSVLQLMQAVAQAETQSMRDAIQA